MFVQFSVVKTYLLEKAIPTILTHYAAEKVTDLPSPLKGQLLFIKALLRLLEGSPQAAEILAGALLTLAVLQPKLDQAWQVEFYQPLSPLEKEQCVSAFLYFMFERLMSDSAYTLNRNADPKFQVLAWWQEALKLRTDLLRSQWLSTLLSSPAVKVAASAPVASLDLLAVDSFVAYFKPSSLVQDPVTVLEQEVDFVKQALQYLERAQWPAALKEAAVQGVSLLEESLSQFTNRSPLDPLTAWKAHYAASLLCKVQLFEQGQAQLGRAMLPLFGLSDVDVIRYWHQALDLADQAMLTLVTQRLHRAELKPKIPLPFFNSKSVIVVPCDEYRKIANPEMG